MRAKPVTGGKRRLPRFPYVLLITALLVLCSPAALPRAAAQAGWEDGRGGASSLPDADVLEDIAGSRPYYSPEVASGTDPGVARLLADMAAGVPGELLPESLLPGVEGGAGAPDDDADAAADKGEAASGTPEDDTGSSAAGSESAAGAPEGDFAAAGAGGWTPPARPYLPSGDPDVEYSAYPYSGVLDGGGRLHFVYGKSTLTDISQPPDGAGVRLEYLQDILYCAYAEGAWNVPGNITDVSSPCDSEVVFMEADDGGYVHIVFTAWLWGRDASRPPGDTSAYQHEQENLWYRYISPDGTISAPRQLTGFTGSWAMLGADFAIRDGRLYGAFAARRNNETAVPSFRAQVGFVEGCLDSWEPAAQLAAWDYDNDPGELKPVYWPVISVSDLGGAVGVTYAALTVPGAAYTGKVDAYGCVREAGGAWSAPQNISNAVGNEVWFPIIALHKPGTGSLTALSFRYVMEQDATHPPRDDLFLIQRSGGAWQAPVNVTRAASQQAANIYAIELDTFGRLHFCYMLVRYSWVGGDWQSQGGELMYVREAEAGMSAPATILPYLFHRYCDDAPLVLDSDGNVHLLFSSCMFDGTNTWDYNIGYSTNAPGGDPGAFSPLQTIRPNTAYTLYDLALSAFPDGDVLASWFERGFDGGGNPVYGRMYSRYRDAGAWGSAHVVSSIPGNTDILHVTQAGWPYLQYTSSSGAGEQQAVFETAKYDIPTAAYYDIRRYFTETVNGVWTTPQLISEAGGGWEDPALYADGGQRYFVLYDSRDGATGKDVVYATQQREPTPPASTYFFAEGTTREGFEEWLCIQNPGEEQTDVAITYMLETGENIEQDVPVPAYTRATVNVNAVVGPEHDVSARVSADKFIVAERPMYFDYHGWAGGHCVMGARDTSRRWFFAEGTTRSGFHEYLTLQNPSDEDAHVDITYVLGNGTTLPGAVDIGPRSRATVNVNLAVGPDRDVSLVVESDTAIVAERPMYFDYRGRTGGHCEVGGTSLATHWYFAEGTTRSGFDTYICLQNPYGVDAEASLTFILDDGSTVVQPMLVPATSRQTLRVNDVVGPGRDVSTVVRSDSLLLAERPMYFLYNGTWPGGHVAEGAGEPKNAWFFAEGTTRAGFVEWLSLQNPGEVDATATLSMMLDDGTVQEAVVDVPAHTRVTVAMPDFVEPERDVSVVVKSDRAIVAERPMYFFYQGKWPGGHVVSGL